MYTTCRTFKRWANEPLSDQIEDGFRRLKETIEKENDASKLRRLRYISTQTLIDGEDIILICSYEPAVAYR